MVLRRHPVSAFPSPNPFQAAQAVLHWLILGLLMCAPSQGRQAQAEIAADQIQVLCLSVLLTWHAGVPWVRGGESWAHLFRVSAVSLSTMQGRGGAGHEWVDGIPVSSEGASPRRESSAKEIGHRVTKAASSLYVCP